MKKCIGKLLMALVIIISAVMLIEGYSIHAAEGKTVRVSTAKQLKKAIKNEDVGTIILRTKAYITITIKADKAAADKFLIVDAAHVNVVNKAVFAGIEIRSVNKYTESVSGNKISITGYFDDYLDTFTVSKKKQVESLKITNGSDYYPGYVLRKGAKVKELVLVREDAGAPVELSLTAGDKTAKLHIADEYGDYYMDYKITIDKYGRISRRVCDSDAAEFRLDYTYKYDSNGNLTSISGRDNEHGKFSDKFTYSNGNLIKRVEDGFDLLQCVYTYDNKGNKTSEKIHSEYHMDGQTWSVTSYHEYEYDKNGRLSYESYEQDDDMSEFAYTYDSKGFKIEEFENNYGLGISTTFTYNKYGDLITVKQTADGETAVMNYKYDKLGNPIN